jgi:hypothetical protein
MLVTVSVAVPDPPKSTGSLLTSAAIASETGAAAS